MYADAPSLCCLPSMDFVSEKSHTLRLEDVDWEQDLLNVRREKRRKVQSYPLIASVGAAIARYLRENRPASKRRELFLGLNAPHGPMSQGAVYHLVATGLKRVGARTTRFGPHSLRHACAGRLVTEGLSPQGDWRSSWPSRSVSNSRLREGEPYSPSGSRSVRLGGLR